MAVGYKRNRSLPTIIPFLVVVLSLFICQTVCQEDGTPASVVDLTPDNFYDVVGKQKYCLVDFFAPWCPHCQRFEPELMRVGKHFEEERVKQRSSNNNIKSTNDEDSDDGDITIGTEVATVPIYENLVIAKLDADKYTDLRTKFNVRGYPTVYWFPPNTLTPVEYKGARDDKSLINWIEHQLVVAKERPVDAVGNAVEEQKPSEEDQETETPFVARLFLVLISLVTFFYQMIVWSIDAEPWCNRSQHGPSLSAPRVVLAALNAFPFLFAAVVFMSEHYGLQVLFVLYALSSVVVQIYYWWWPYFFSPTRVFSYQTIRSSSNNYLSSLAGDNNNSDICETGQAGLGRATAENGSANDNWNWLHEYQRYYADNFKFFGSAVRKNGSVRVVPDADHTVFGTLLVSNLMLAVMAL